jgi:hypothetical protein
VALIMPSVTLERRPSGLPIASARSPTFSFDESANRAGLRPVSVVRMTARSLAAKAPRSVARCRVPSCVVTVNVRAPETTWAFVTMSPSPSNTIPDPSLPVLSICTTDGSAT